MGTELDRLEEHFHRIGALAPAEREAALRVLEEDESGSVAAAVRDLLIAAEMTSSPLDGAATPATGELTLVDDLRALLFAPEDGDTPIRPATEPACEALEILPRVPGYNVLRRIGRGGSGTVYLAEQVRPEFARPVALKVVDRVADPGAMRRVQDERHILARLEHPGIARLYDAGVTPAGQPYLAMERVDGLPIFEHCCKRDLTVRDRLALFLEVLDAVEYAHRAGVVHRDLKPANILVSDRGETKLLDFGIAKLIAGPGEDEETRTLGRAMTLAYASPEQVLGQRVTVASDVYSLGVVLYELLAETLPYQVDGVRFETYEDAVRGQDPEPPSTASTRATGTTSSRRFRFELSRRRQAVRGDLDAVVLKALRKEPGARYGSVAELAEDLRRVLSGQPVAARGANRRYRLARFFRRQWKRVALAAVLAAAGAVVAVPELRNRILLPLLVRRSADELSSFAAVRSGSSAARAALRAGAAGLRRWDGLAARQSFARAAALLPGQAAEALAWDGLSRSEGLLGEVGRAAAAARHAADVESRFAGLPAEEGERILARGLAAERAWERAIPALDRLFGRSPARVDIGLDLVAALLASGQTEAANATLGRIVQVLSRTGGAERDPRVDLVEAETAYRLGEQQRAAAAAARARDWALERGVLGVRLRAERLHAQAIAKLDLRAEAQTELTRLGGEMAAAGMDGEAAASQLALGKILARTADNARARATLEQALTGLRAAEDRAGEVGALLALAFQSSKGGDLQESQALARRAVALAREIGDRWGEGEALVGSLALANWAEDSQAVLETQGLALQALRDSANRQTLLATLNNLALEAIERLELERAEAYLDEAAGLAQRIGNRLADAGLDRAYGYLEESRGAHDLARQRYESALDKARRADVPISIATYLGDLAWLEVAADRPDAAADRAGEAIAAQQAVGRLGDAVELSGVLAWVEARRGNRGAAYERLAGLRRAAGEAAAAPSFSSLVLEARIAEALGDWRRAVELRRRTVRMAGELAMAGPLIEERYGLVRALEGAGERRESRRLASELLSEAEARGVRGVARGLRTLLGTPS